MGQTKAGTVLDSYSSMQRDFLNLGKYMYVKQKKKKFIHTVTTAPPDYMMMLVFASFPPPLPALLPVSPPDCVGIYTSRYIYIY